MKRGFIFIFLIISFFILNWCWGIGRRELREVERRLEKVVGRDFAVRIKHTKEINAYATENGKIFITSKMLEMCATKEELAFVLAHEMAHIVLRHHQKQREKEVIGALLGVVVGKIAGADEEYEFRNWAKVGATLLGEKRSRKQEYQADEFAINLMNKAGFNPWGSVEILRRLREIYGDGPADIPLLGWLASHPVTRNRIRKLENLIRGR